MLVWYDTAEAASVGTVFAVLKEIVNQAAGAKAVRASLNRPIAILFQADSIS